MTLKRKINYLKFKLGKSFHFALRLPCMSCNLCMCGTVRSNVTYDKTATTIYYSTLYHKHQLSSFLFIVIKLIITVQKLHGSDWSDGVRLDCSFYTLLSKNKL